jgi:hypothetical protein
MAPSWRQIIFPHRSSVEFANGFLVRKILTAFCLPEHCYSNRPPIPGVGDDGLPSIPRYLCEILYDFSLIEEGFMWFLRDFFSTAFKISLRIFPNIIAYRRLFPRENLSKR